MQENKVCRVGGEGEREVGLVGEVGCSEGHPVNTSYKTVDRRNVFLNLA